MKKIIRHREQGAVAPLVGILMVAFILCVALVVDLGHLHNVKIQLQRAVDAAALAGAQQLDGSDQATHPEAVARATADINRVDGETDWENDTNVIVELGLWNPDLSAVPPRFTLVGEDAENTANAIRVAATVNVEYYFFLFGSGSAVTADAIAVNKHEETALPIALLSCLPTNEGVGENVCGIELYKWSNDPEDTAGWTGLTYETNSAQLKYFFTEEGNDVLNQVLYGGGLAHKGLENEPVMEGDSTYNSTIPCGNKNVKLDIKCGLGPDFPDVDPLPVDGDPLFDYVQNPNDPLPRWDDDAFARIWSMGGILEQGYVAAEIDADYKARLEALKDASDKHLGGDPTPFAAYDANYPFPPLPDWAKDGRWSVMVSDKGEALFDQTLLYAGYPTVQVENGVNNAALQAFLALTTEDINDGHFNTSLTRVNPPLDATADEDPHNAYGGGETFAVTIPVIFAGVCGEWKALGDKFYIGIANLLITRIWQSPSACYDTSNPVTVFQNPPSGPDCPGGFNPVPALDGNTYACGTGASAGVQAGIEALITPRGDEETKAGIQKIYLVE